MFLASATPMKTMPQSTNTYQEQSLIQLISPDVMLSHARVQKQLRQIEQLVNMPAAYYKATYLSLVSNFAEYVQMIPSLEGGQLGGLFYEGLQRAILAIQLQQDSLREYEPLFTFAVFSAALLLDLRKLLVDKKIMVSNETGGFIAEWVPFVGPISKLGMHYKIRTFHRPITQLSPYLTLLLARQIMPEAGLLWLADDYSLLNMWLAALCGDEEGAGGIGHFLNMARNRMNQLEQKPKFTIAVEITQPHEVELGEKFWNWLRKIMTEQEINLSDEGVYVVEQGIFLEVPKIFQEFCIQEKLPAWTSVYKQFMELGIAATNREGNDVTNPDKLFIYLNKAEISPGKILQKSVDAKKSSGSFFNADKQAGDKGHAISKNQETIQASYLKQGLLINQREWFLKGISKKLALKEILKAFISEQSNPYARLGFILEKTNTAGAGLQGPINLSKR